LSKELGNGIKKDGFPEAMISVMVEPPDLDIIRSAFLKIS